MRNPRHDWKLERDAKLIETLVFWRDILTTAFVLCILFQGCGLAKAFAGVETQPPECRPTYIVSGSEVAMCLNLCKHHTDNYVHEIFHDANMTLVCKCEGGMEFNVKGGIK